MAESTVERGVDEGKIAKNINLARFFIEMTGLPDDRAGCPVVSLRDPVFNLTSEVDAALINPVPEIFEELDL